MAIKIITMYLPDPGAGSLAALLPDRSRFAALTAGPQPTRHRPASPRQITSRSRLDNGMVTIVANG